MARTDSRVAQKRLRRQKLRVKNRRELRKAKEAAAE
jgi:hypothetical protein